MVPEILLPFFLAVLAILAAPGPDMVFVVVASEISAGRRGGCSRGVGEHDRPLVRSQPEKE